jgi:hypothetical protein
LGVKVLNRILPALFGRRAPPLNSGNDEALFNYALELAQEWGKEWLQPIQKRLQKVYPSLSQADLDRLNTVAQEAMKFGHDLVFTMLQEASEDVDESAWRKTYSARFPWVDEKNLKHLFSTGNYYARK